VPQLYEEAVKSPLPADFDTRPTTISSTGALVAYSGMRTGRSPTDKRIVDDDLTHNDVWWGPVNKPISTEQNRFCRDLAVRYLNTRRNLFVVDGYAGWDPEYRLKIRVLCSRPYHALFMKNMLIRPTASELERDFAQDKDIDFHIFNAGELLAPQPIPGTATPTSV
jgi:phosphoenolpyruvate carboxykinase (ATP)